ncbi:MAG: 3-deoxy-D-manno-octulosonic acid transferase, partial [Planctomycetales bacterium]|nr:3-deoxy-D-manno-octulosonic acid transferase [Planctomycetales bacterium]
KSNVVRNVNHTHVSFVIFSQGRQPMRFWMDPLYATLFLLSLPWLIWQSIRTGKYREGWGQKLLGLVPPRTGLEPCFWFHAVSVGEVNLLSAILPAIRDQWPGAAIVISSTTQTGHALARQRFPEHQVCYAPLDFSWAVRRACRRVRPTALVLVELEVWPQWIRQARRTGATVAVVNGRLSAKSFRGYQRLRRFLASTFAQLDIVLAQTEEYAARFQALGVPANRIHVTGSVKFDNVSAQRENPRTRALMEVADISPADRVFLAGSTQAGEEEIVLAAFMQVLVECPRLRLLLVPRHPERFNEVAQRLDATQLTWMRRSELSSEACDRSSWQVLLVDTVGELSAWWGSAASGFVGGSLGSRGGQNMIEPAAYGVAVCFGPNTQNFRDVVQLLLANQAAEVVRNVDELADFMRRTAIDAAWTEELGRRAKTVVASQQGATARSVDLLRRAMQDRTLATDGATPPASLSGRSESLAARFTSPH